MFVPVSRADTKMAYSMHKFSCAQYQGVSVCGAADGGYIKKHWSYYRFSLILKV